ncbi:MAG: hypothetical protein U0354_04990 [Candidatus Sericytochromatia bacterium]
MKKIIALVLSSFVISCSNNQVQNFDTVNTQSPQEASTFNSSKNININDDEIGSSLKNSAIKINKLDIESKNKSNTNLNFKTTIIKKGKTINSKDSQNFNIFGVISYPDDKGNLKQGANITVSLSNDGKNIVNAVTDENGNWTASLDKSKYSGKNIAVSFQFSNKYWMIGGKDKSYSWSIDSINNLSSDIDLGTISPVKGSENAKAAFINDIYNRYLKMFKKEGINVDTWWTVQLKTVWPQNSNYYAWKTVNLSDADHWDVNGHEIGHAMTDIGTNSSMGGGQHKIDECYTENLAWSEGFATFLSSVISLDKSDPDAKFEFLVPRRAPIRQENVPTDVCNGQKNEWRVGATMWDIYDTHVDGDDNISVPFKTIWQSVTRKEKRIGSMKDAADSLKAIAPEYNEALDKSLKFNTMF